MTDKEPRDMIPKPAVTPNSPNMKKLAVACFVTIGFLTGCGGGGGGGSPAAGTSEGFWTGTTSTGYGVNIAVLENGETWGVYTSGGYLVGALHGQSSGTGTSFAAAGSNFNLVNWSVTSGSYTGTVTAKSTISATSNTGASISMRYSSDYDSAATLINATGNYTVYGVSALGSANGVSMNVTSGGLITSTISGTCSATGSLAPRGSGKNVYNLTMTFNGSGCALGNGGTASGILLLDRTSIPVKALALALTPNQQDGFIGIGVKN